MPAVILDRDGVINYDSEFYIKSPDEWLPIPGSLNAIALLNRAGFDVYVATNQSGIARGYYDHATLHSIHSKMHEALCLENAKIVDVAYCPHHPQEQCACRKPQPGLLHQLRDKHKLNLEQIYYIGDSTTDVLAGLAAGCKPLLVLTGNGERSRFELEDHALAKAIPHFKDLLRAVDYVIQHPLG